MHLAYAFVRFSFFVIRVPTYCFRFSRTKRFENVTTRYLDSNRCLKQRYGRCFRNRTHTVCVHDKCRLFVFQTIGCDRRGTSRIICGGKIVNTSKTKISKHIPGYLGARSAVNSRGRFSEEKRLPTRRRSWWYI